MRQGALEDLWFPDRDEAEETNRAALTESGQSNHALLRPSVLEGALSRAQMHYHYGTGDEHEKIAKAAAALVNGVGQAQAFEDGNKRTAMILTHSFLEENGYPHAVVEDDTELADHLLGYGEGTHAMEDTADMLLQRMRAKQASWQRHWSMDLLPEPEIPADDDIADYEQREATGLEWEWALSKEL